LQVVRYFLLHRPIHVQGREFGSLCQYYFEIDKSIQKGHHCNLQALKVSQAIRSPTLQFNGLLLNQQQAVVCDIVHWGLTDYLRKRLAENKNLCAEVSCPSLFVVSRANLVPVVRYSSAFHMQLVSAGA
jgi:hypothetical protein